MLCKPTKTLSKYMKLAEALQIRADLQRRLAQMPSRLRNNATMQEGSAPTENPRSLLEETDGILSRLEEVTTRINITNSTVTDDEGNTLTALISRRDMLRRKAEILRDFANQAADITPRRTLTEIRVISTVDVEALQKHCDTLSKTLRETDIKIQSLNWTKDLIQDL